MKHLICFLVGLCILGMTAWTEASVISIPQVSTFSSGDLMAGMEVTVSYGTYSENSSGGYVYTTAGDSYATWGSLGSGLWGAAYSYNQNPVWSLSLPESIDTMDLDGYWTLSLAEGYYISSILISGLPGNTVFDVSPQPFGVTTPLSTVNLPDLPDGVTIDNIGDTSGSGQGLVFDFTGPFGWAGGTRPIVSNLWNTTAPNVSFQYLNPVKLDSATAPLYDLYADLQIFFHELDGAEAPYFVGGGNPFYFYADTDTVVPEPGTLALLGLGLLILTGVQRKYRWTP